MQAAEFASDPATLAYLNADFSKAERLYKQALIEREKTLGPRHIDVALTLNALGLLYCTLGDYSKAEEFYKKARTVFEQTLGVEHPQVALTVRHLADITRIRGQSDESDKLSKRALQIWLDYLAPAKTELPEEIPDFEALYGQRQSADEISSLYKVAQAHSQQPGLDGKPFPVAAMYELAMLYRGRLKYRTANRLFEHALEQSKSTAGQSVSVAAVWKDFADNCVLGLDYDRAEKAYHKALEVYGTAGLLEHPDVAAVYQGMATVADARGNSEQAEKLYLIGIGILQDSVGTQHAKIAYALRMVAKLRWNAGRLSEAELSYKRAMDILQQALGFTHKDVAETCDELGRLYQAQRKFDEAEALYYRAIDIAGSQHGPQPPIVATFYDQLANVYQAKGKFNKAESVFQRALQIRQHALLSCHEDIAGTVADMARFYLNWGKYNDAEGYYKQALDLAEKLYGPKSAPVAKCLNGIGILHYKLGRTKDAESTLKDALEINEQLFGTQSAHLVPTLSMLGQVYTVQGRFREARERYEYALEIVEQGEDANSASPAILNLIADMKLEQHISDEAIALCEQALKRIEQTRERDYSEFVTALTKLGMIYSRRKDCERANALLERALAVSTEHLGANSSETIVCLNCLAKHCLETKRVSESLTYYKQSIDTGERVLGAHHPLLASTFCQVAEYYTRQNNSLTAAEFYLRALRIMESTFGPSHPDLASGLIALAKVNISEGNYEDAEPMLKRGIAIRERCLGMQDPATLNAIMALADLNERRGSRHEADRLYEQVKLNWMDSLTLQKPTALDAVCTLLTRFLRSQRAKEALDLALQELQIREDPRRRPGADLAGLYICLTEITHELGKNSESKQYGLKAIALLESTSEPQPELLAKALIASAQTLMALKEYEQAESFLRCAAESITKIFGQADGRSQKLWRKLAVTCSDIGRAKLDECGSLEQALDYAKRSSEAFQKVAIQKPINDPRYPRSKAGYAELQQSALDESLDDRSTALLTLAAAAERLSDYAAMSQAFIDVIQLRKDWLASAPAMLLTCWLKLAIAQICLKQFVAAKFSISDAVKICLSMVSAEKSLLILLDRLEEVCTEVRVVAEVESLRLEINRLGELLRARVRDS